MIAGSSNALPFLPRPSETQSFCDVSALEAGSLRLPAANYIKDASPSEAVMCPTLSFLLHHSTYSDSREYIVFDLGLRRDISTYQPSVQERIKTIFQIVQVPQTVDESLKKGGIQPADISTVILSHLHFDHIGDSSPFVNATFVLGGDSRGQLETGYPHTPNSLILSSAVPEARTRFIDSSGFNISIGPFPRAMDYYGDGSLYLIDAAGHLPGHINVLVRTNATGSWVYLASDTAHDIRILTGEKEIATFVDPKNGRLLCAHADKHKAEEHISRVRSLLNVPGVQVLLTHDWRWYNKNKDGATDAFFPGKISPASVII